MAKKYTIVIVLGIEVETDRQAELISEAVQLSAEGYGAEVKVATIFQGRM